MNAREHWTIVSTAPLDEGSIRRLVGDDVGASFDVVVVDPRTEEAAADAVADADIVIGDYTFAVPISRTVIERMQRCRLIQQPSVGYQQIDVDAAAEVGIPVANAAGGNDAAVAEYTVMAALMLMKHPVWLDAQVRSGAWPQLDVAARGHFELTGKVWGIVGFGRIGRQVAQRLRGWDVDVAYFDPVAAPAEVETDLGVRRLDLDALLTEADVVSLHTPLTSATHHLVDAAALERMKPGAYLVNVARGEIVDEAALVDALREGRIKAAALDVFAEEPLPEGHALTALDNVLLTPHTAGTPIEAQIRIIKITAENVRRVLRGEAPFNVVNGVAVDR
jgi:phosphoglycerate dehydrogenase-like enzyme